MNKKVCFVFMHMYKEKMKRRIMRDILKYKKRKLK